MTHDPYDFESPQNQPYGPGTMTNAEFQSCMAEQMRANREPAWSESTSSSGGDYAWTSSSDSSGWLWRVAGFALLGFFLVAANGGEGLAGALIGGIVGLFIRQFIMIAVGLFILGLLGLMFG